MTLPPCPNEPHARTHTDTHTHTHIHTHRHTRFPLPYTLAGVDCAGRRGRRGRFLGRPPLKASNTNLDWYGLVQSVQYGTKTSADLNSYILLCVGYVNTQIIIISIIHNEAELKWFPPSPLGQPLTSSNGRPDFVDSQALEPFNPDLWDLAAFTHRGSMTAVLRYMAARLLRLLDFHDFDHY